MEWALIGEPCRSYAYFITRKKVIDQNLIKKSLAALRDKYEYTNTDNVVYTKQENCPNFPGWDESLPQA